MKRWSDKDINSAVKGSDTSWIGVYVFIGCVIVSTLFIYFIKHKDDDVDKKPFVLPDTWMATDYSNTNTNSVKMDKVDLIISAKNKVRAKVNYPDTLDFHDMKTRVNGSSVTLTYTAKNAFGVPTTITETY